MDFILGAFVGALAMAAAVAISITYDDKITEYRIELGLEDIEDEES